MNKLILMSALTDKVFNFGRQINLKGTKRPYYSPSEINGNTESNLEFTNSAKGGGWLAEP